MKTFAKNTTTTLLTQIISLIFGIGVSVILARALGPEGKGIYSLAILLPTLVATFTNLGIAPATVYYTAKGYYDSKQILTSNIILSLVIGLLSVMIGFFTINFFGDSLFPGLPKNYAILALLLIPLILLAENLKKILLGLQRIPRVNFLNLSRYLLILISLSLALLLLNKDVLEALLATIAAWSLLIIITFVLVSKTAKGLARRVNFHYIKSTLKYGTQAHLGNVFGFLHYRLDIILINLFINPVAVGLYSISVGVAEQLWLASKATSEVLLPKLAAEKNEKRRKEFTPIISRNVLLITAVGGFILFLLTESIITFLYSSDFLPAVLPLQILIPGIVARSASRILANDIAARGKPLKNSTLSLLALIINIGLNILWIPKFGIAGAAWATTISYSVTFVGRIIIYSNLSRNNVIKILIPQPSDLILYKKFGALIINRISGSKSNQ
jgi:O-antigen/teichoic acid export membrane protein